MIGEREQKTLREEEIEGETWRRDEAGKKEEEGGGGGREGTARREMEKRRAKTSRQRVRKRIKRGKFNGSLKKLKYESTNYVSNKNHYSHDK